MYSKCVSCPKLGTICRGPKFGDMTAQQVLDWCRQRKAFLNWSNAKIAEKADMPKGTIDRLFAGEHIDFRYETIRPVLKALLGGGFSGELCATPADAPNMDLVLQVHDLEKDLSYADKTIKNLEGELRSWRKAIFSLVFLCGVMAASLIGYIRMDFANTDIGLVREDYMSPAVLFPILGVFAAIVAAALLIRYVLKTDTQEKTQ